MISIREQVLSALQQNLGTDIAEQKRAEQHVRESEQRLQRVLETDAVCVHGDHGSHVDHELMAQCTRLCRECAEICLCLRRNG